MEIEKKRETSWKIQLKKSDEYIEITSVEISGIVRLIKLAIINKDKSVKVEMTNDDFFKFLSLISAFKDVVVGEDSILSNNVIENKQQDIQEYSKIEEEEEIFGRIAKSSGESLKNNDPEELNPEEWDPW